jgi:uncharacterized protein (TIGR03435 family)
MWKRQRRTNVYLRKIRSINLDIRRLLLGLVIGAASGAFSRANAQTTTPAASDVPFAYDVVSVKLNPSGGGPWGFDLNNTKFSGKNISIVTLLAAAYNLNPDMVSGVTGAVGSVRFDVEAKVLDANAESMKKVDDSVRRAMVQKLLEERFALKAHKEVKTLPVYELVVDRGGLKAKPSAPEDKGELSRRNGEVSGQGMPMSAMALALTDLLKRTVFDKTGLGEAKYRFHLKWTPDTVTDAGADGGPSIFTALQEQLGLKLVPAKGPVDTLVVDHVEMPTEN